MAAGALVRHTFFFLDEGKGFRREWSSIHPCIRGAREILTFAAIQAGITEHAVMFPVDSIKVRLSLPN
jgi:hypothetical protein